ncbi:MAG: hypothetical protein NXH75_02080 [Halobacteriovoraceae bacterium]|nr:hypothetical protein [Halobacteriovoraceae bacterium]
MSTLRQIFTIALFFFFANSTFAKIVAVVSKLEGKAFYSAQGKTHTLSEGMHIPAQAEIFTDLGAQVSINDYYDHIYHLSGGAHVVVYTNLIELKEGYLWMKSLAYDELKGPFRVTTPNAVVENQTGEGIVSFDVYTGKTQLLSIKGDFEFKNSQMENLGITLSEGQFSFIHNEHEKGHPRKATPIGYASYKKITGLFEGVQPFDKQEKIVRKTFLSTNPPKKKVRPTTPQNNRGVASVKSNKAFDQALEAKKAGHTTVRRLREPASQAQHQEKVMDYYQQKVKQLAKPKPKKKWNPGYQKKSGVPVRVFGQRTSGRRGPASVKRQAPGMVTLKPGETAKKYKKKVKTRMPASIGGMLPKVNTNAFESELLNQYKNQMRHDQEVNDLIDQLESVDMDYKKEY